MNGPGELIENVAADIEHLRNAWSTAPNQHELRRSSSVLRRLLVEGELGRAWRAAGFKGEPRVKAPDLNIVLKPYEKHGLRHIVFAMTPGASYMGKNLAVIMAVATWEGLPWTCPPELGPPGV